MMMDPKEKEKIVRAAAREFPAVFHLRGTTDKLFRISIQSSYVNDSGQVMLYTEIQSNGQWLSYAKGSVSELRNAIVRVK